MRSYGVALVALFAFACGSKPPQAPTAPSDLVVGSSPASSTGVAALAPELDSNADAVLTADLASMRANPLLWKMRFAADTGRDPLIAAMMTKIDKIDLRATIPKQGEPEIVAVVWGKLPNDPREEQSLKVTFDDGRSLASGVKEYAATGGELPAHVFVVKDGVWVITTGSNTARVRDHYVATSSTPARPSGDLLRLRANRTALMRSGQASGKLADIEKVDISLGSSLRAVVSFMDADAARVATTQIRQVTAFLSLALLANSECKALEKVSIDVKNDAKDVTVEVKGIADAMAAWNDEACKAKREPDAVPPNKRHKRDQTL